MRQKEKGRTERIVRSVRPFFLYLVLIAQSAKPIKMRLPERVCDIGIANGVARMEHFAVANVNADVGDALVEIVCVLKEHKISGLCLAG